MKKPNPITNQVKRLLHPCSPHVMATDLKRNHANTICCKCKINYEDLPIGAEYRMIYSHKIVTHTSTAEHVKRLLHFL